VIEEIPAALAGERLDRVVSMLTGASRAAAARLVDAGDVVVNGDVVETRTHRVAEGDEIEIGAVPDTSVVAEPDAEVAVAVVHQDADLLVVDKPPGMVVHPGAGTPGGTLVNGLLARFPELAAVGDPARPGIVHRLDKGTSGLLVVARSPAAYEGLVTQLAHHDVDREYVALVWGRLDAPAGMVDAPIGRSARTPTRMAVSTRGKQARTRYRVREEYEHPVVVSLVDCQLETGRTHQIRVHLSAIDHPVVGDGAYGGDRSSLPAPRPLLHACELRFAHPVTGRTVHCTSPIPADMQAVLDELS
jgi:23S rRNA pseudouridine1911/1915/1917 synthase